MTTRASIIAAVEAALSGITRDNGYTTDAGQTVEQWRTRPVIQGEPRPALTVRDTTDSIELRYGQAVHTLTLEIDAVTDGDTTAATLRELAGDVLAALGSNETWGGLAEGTEAKQITLEVVRDGQPAGSLQVQATVTYATESFKL